MNIEKTKLAGILCIKPQRHQDIRGFFTEIYNSRILAEAGIRADFVQDNLSFSRHARTIRGLHYQLPPHAQGKLVSVLAGCILDVVVDIRQDSPTYGEYDAIEISAENGKQIWVPPGFAHGFCTLTADTTILYKVTDYYAPEYDRGIVWNDPDIGIDWPLAHIAPTLSDKDIRLPRLCDIDMPFIHKAA